jgi:hypothetical protein
MCTRIERTSNRRGEEAEEDLRTGESSLGMY